ncbi:MAG TPA: hypothetical protein VMW52_02565, partial [Phycisphaerae bacterium]|nr:hypothetical protein [Phycisphaerae bacterium]
MSFTRRSFLRQVAAYGVVAGASGGLRAVAAEPRKPNIIYIMSDELGYYELSCMGNPHFKTPNVDRLAAEGV